METVVLTKDGELPLPSELSPNQVLPKNLVTKSNRLVEAHYRLTAAEQKFVIAAVSLIEPQDTGLKLYTMPIADVVKALEITNKDFRTRLRQRVKAIFKKPISIKLPDGDDLICNWFSSVRISTRDGYLTLCFDPQLRPYLLELKSRFTSYQLANIVQLGSAYSIRLYEILKGLENAPLQQRAIPISDLRGMLGIPPDKYKLYGPFKKFVVEPARKEIAEKTDIEFSYIERKLGRKITWLIFTVTRRKRAFCQSQPGEPEIDMADLAPPVIDPAVMDYIPPAYRDHIETLKLVAAAVDQHGNGYAMRNLAYVASRKPGNYPAYVAHALQKDYGKDYYPQQQGLFPPAARPDPAEIVEASTATTPVSGRKKWLLEQPLGARPKSRPQVQVIPGERVMYGGLEYVIEAGRCIALGNGTSLTEMQIRKLAGSGKITIVTNDEDCDDG